MEYIMAKAKGTTQTTTDEAIDELRADFRAKRRALQEKHCEMKDGKPVFKDESVCTGWKFLSDEDEKAYKESFKELALITRRKFYELEAMQKASVDPPALTDEERAKGFEIGKCYRHAAGEEIHVLGITETDASGECMFAESNRETFYLKMIGMDAGARENWSEISLETWKQNFEE
jgi:hypothetical protein